MNKRPAPTLSWTREEDDQLLAAAASGKTVAAASKRLSRSEKAIWIGREGSGLSLRNNESGLDPLHVWPRP